MGQQSVSGCTKNIKREGREGRGRTGIGFEVFFLHASGDGDGHDGFLLVSPTTLALALAGRRGRVAAQGRRRRGRLHRSSSSRRAPHTPHARHRPSTVVESGSTVVEAASGASTVVEAASASSAAAVRVTGRSAEVVVAVPAARASAAVRASIVSASIAVAALLTAVRGRRRRRSIWWSSSSPAPPPLCRERRLVRARLACARTVHVVTAARPVERVLRGAARTGARNRKMRCWSARALSEVAARTAAGARGARERSKLLWTYSRATRRRAGLRGRKSPGHRAPRAMASSESSTRHEGNTA